MQLDGGLKIYPTHSQSLRIPVFVAQEYTLKVISWLFIPRKYFFQTWALSLRIPCQPYNTQYTEDDLFTVSQASTWVVSDKSSHRLLQQELVFEVLLALEAPTTFNH